MGTDLKHTYFDDGDFFPFIIISYLQIFLQAWRAQANPSLFGELLLF